MSKSRNYLKSLSVLAMMVAMTGAANAQSWQGPYGGVHVGVGHSDNVLIDVDGFIGPGPGFVDPGSVIQPGPGARFPHDDSAVAYGAHLGYDWQLGSIVVGLETDFTFVDSASARPVDLVEGDETALSDTDYVATLRGRAGWTNGNILVFATAGLALGRLEDQLFDLDLDASGQYTIYDTDDSFIDRRTELGWVAGGGVELRVAENWRLRAEAQYVDFGSSTSITNLADDAIAATGPQRFDVENEMLIGRLGVSYSF